MVKIAPCYDHAKNEGDHMEKRFFTYIGFGFVVVALIAVGWSIMQLISAEFTSDKKGDFATWMGAVFAGAAFVGTIRIAIKTDRVRQREQWDTAVVLASGMLERISQVLNTLKEIDDFLQMRIAELEFGVLPVTGGRSELTEWGKSVSVAIDECPKFEIDELTGIIVLPNRAAAHIAAAMQRIWLIRDDMQRASQNRLHSTITPHQYLTNQRRNIVTCTMSLKIAQAECKRVVQDVSNDVAFHYRVGTTFD